MRGSGFFLLPGSKIGGVNLQMIHSGVPLNSQGSRPGINLHLFVVNTPRSVTATGEGEGAKRLWIKTWRERFRDGNVPERLVAP